MMHTDRTSRVSMKSPSDPCRQHDARGIPFKDIMR